MPQENQVWKVPEFDVEVGVGWTVLSRLYQLWGECCSFQFFRLGDSFKSYWPWCGGTLQAVSGNSPGPEWGSSGRENHESVSKQMIQGGHALLYIHLFCEAITTTICAAASTNVCAQALPCPPGRPCVPLDGAAVFHWTQWADDRRCLTNACCAPHSFSLSDEPDEQGGEGWNDIIKFSLWHRLHLGAFMQLIKHLCMD